MRLLLYVTEVVVHDNVAINEFGVSVFSRPLIHLKFYFIQVINIVDSLIPERVAIGVHYSGRPPYIVAATNGYINLVIVEQLDGHVGILHVDFFGNRPSRIINFAFKL